MGETHNTNHKRMKTLEELNQSKSLYQGKVQDSNGSDKHVKPVKSIEELNRVRENSTISYGRSGEKYADPSQTGGFRIDSEFKYPWEEEDEKLNRHKEANDISIPNFVLQETDTENENQDNGAYSMNGLNLEYLQSILDAEEDNLEDKDVKIEDSTVNNHNSNLVKEPVVETQNSADITEKDFYQQEKEADNEYEETFSRNEDKIEVEFDKTNEFEENNTQYETDKIEDDLYFEIEDDNEVSEESLKRRQEIEEIKARIERLKAEIEKIEIKNPDITKPEEQTDTIEFTQISSENTVNKSAEKSIVEEKIIPAKLTGVQSEISLDTQNISLQHEKHEEESEKNSHTGNYEDKPKASMQSTGYQKEKKTFVQQEKHLKTRTFPTQSKPASRLGQETKPEELPAKEKQQEAVILEEKEGLTLYKVVKEVMTYAICVVIALVLALLLVTFVGQKTEVIGDSMNPGLQNGEQLVVDKISYRFSDPKRFEVVVFPHENTNYIKRIIGLPGETVSVEEGYIYINGQLLSEDNYGSEPIAADNYNRLLKPVTLGENEYFVLGDNRNNSCDSRDPDVGNVTKKSLIGRAIFRIWPIKKMGSLN